MDRSCYIGRTLEEIKQMQKQTIMNIYKELVFLIFCGGSAIVMPNLVTGGIFGGELIKIISKEISLYDFVNKRRFYLQNSKEYITLERSYRIVLEELLKLFTSLNWDNEMQLFSGYSYMLRNGYLSCEHHFYYSNDTDSCYGFLGSNVIEGRGDCKHINAMLTDLLMTKGSIAYNLALLMNDNQSFSLLCDDFVSKLENNDDENECNEQEVEWILKNGNHVVTLYIDKEHSYVMDAMNNLLFYIESDLSVYHEKQKFSAFYHSYLNQGKKIKLTDILKPSFTKILDSRLDDYYGVLEMCPECIDIFERFYQQHKELYGEVIVKRKVLIRELNKYCYSSD